MLEILKFVGEFEIFKMSSSVFSSSRPVGHLHRFPAPHIMNNQNLPELRQVWSVQCRWTTGLEVGYTALQYKAFFVWFVIYDKAMFIIVYGIMLRVVLNCFLLIAFAIL